MTFKTFCRWALALIVSLLSVTVAQAAVTIAYAGTAISTTVSTSLSFASAPIGTAANDRFVVVALMNRNAQGLATSVSVGSIPCIEIADDGGPIGSSIWITSVPVETGTTATVSVVYAIANDTTRINMYAVGGIGSNAGYSSVGGNATGGGTATITGFDVPAGGGAIVIASCSSGSTTPTITPTGITLTNNQNVNASSLGTRTESMTTSTAIKGASFSVTASTASPRGAMVSFIPPRPAFLLAF